jgi:hypothetical protein
MSTSIFYQDPFRYPTSGEMIACECGNPDFRTEFKIVKAKGKEENILGYFPTAICPKCRKKFDLYEPSFIALELTEGSSG